MKWQVFMSILWLVLAGLVGFRILEIKNEDAPRIAVVLSALALSQAHLARSEAQDKKK